MNSINAALSAPILEVFRHYPAFPLDLVERANNPKILGILDRAIFLIKSLFSSTIRKLYTFEQERIQLIKDLLPSNPNKQGDTKRVSTIGNLAIKILFPKITIGDSDMIFFKMCHWLTGETAIPSKSESYSNSELGRMIASSIKNEKVISNGRQEQLLLDLNSDRIAPLLSAKEKILEEFQKVHEIASTITFFTSPKSIEKKLEDVRQSIHTQLDLALPTSRHTP